MKQSELEKISLGNAAGTIKTLEQVMEACRSAMTNITVGSITLEQRHGNQGDTYYYHPQEQWSLNALGLPNPGLAYYQRLLPEMKRRAHAAGKNLHVSVAGFRPEEYAILALECIEAGADEVELNLGCPNIWGTEGQKPIPSYHPAVAAEIFEKVKSALSPQKMWVKVSPLDDVQGIDALARVIDESEIVSTIVVSNTIPNQNRLRENGLPALTFNDGNHQGGLAGKALISRSLETLGNFTTLLPNHSFIGVGGIFTGQDALQYWRRGVDGFQCGTAFIEFGPQLFSDIYTQLAEKVA